jgi:Tannase and feruloyl esterase
VLLLASSRPLAAAPSCETLTTQAPAGATIASAVVVATGAFRVPGSPAGGPEPFDFSRLPAFCRVSGVLAPTPNSHIAFEVWLPVAGWNGKYQGVGNGGFAGEINYSDLATALSAGYATASTDTGHQAGGADARWALGHPEKVIDYGHRAIHETAVAAKALVRSFYGEPARYSYFSSCSNGGRQALMEAQRYPADYDGIIAGAPAADFSRTAALFVSNLRATTTPEGFIPPSTYAAVEQAVNAVCDAQDGVADGVVSRPDACAFDPAALSCKAAGTASCLTPAQVDTMKTLYAGLRDGTGRQLHPGFVPGAESGPGGWGLWLTGAAPSQSLEFAFGTQFFQNLVYGDPAYGVARIDPVRDLAAAQERVGPILDATDPDLSAFNTRGGKLILYHGWNDAALPPAATIDYYHRVVESLGQSRVDGFVRLYMIPGLQHCFGGPGTGRFGGLPEGGPRPADPEHSMSASLERWVEEGAAPRAITASRLVPGDPGRVAFTRPLCPYPQVARYKGTGDSSQSSSFTCAVATPAR